MNHGISFTLGFICAIVGVKPRILVLALLLIPMAAPGGHAAGLVPDATACWLFDELSGTVAKDACGANDGTYTNGPLLQAEGVFGFAADFDGTNDHVRVPHASNLQPTTTFTFHAWVWLDATGNGQLQNIARKLTLAGGPDGYFVRANQAANDKWQCTILNGGVSVTALSLTSTVAQEWTWVGCTLSGGSVCVYVNGVMEACSTGAVSTVGASTSDLFLGSSTDENPPITELLNGRLDRIAFAGLVFTERQMMDAYLASEFEQASQEKVWLHISTTTNGAVATANVKVPRERDKEPILSAFSTWEISGTYTAPATVGGGTQTFQFAADGVNVAGCTWSVTRGAIAVGVAVASESNYLIRCPHPFYLEPGTHTVAVTIGGAAMVTHSRSDFVVLQETSHLDYGSLYGPLSHQLIRFEHNQTNSYVNTTNTTLHNDHITQGLYLHCQNTTAQIGDCQGIHSNLTEVHTHIDSHFDQVLLAIATGNVTNGTNGSLTMQIDLEGFEFIVWIMIVAVAIFAAVSRRTILVLLSFPLGVFSIIYGIRVFDSMAFDLAALLVGILLAVVAFKERENLPKEKKNVD